MAPTLDGLPQPASSQPGPAQPGRNSSALAIIARFALHSARMEVRRAFFAHRLGPFASTLGLAALIALVGTLFGTILKSHTDGYDAYLPALACGLIAWTFLSASLTESCARITDWARILRHTPVPPAALPAGAVLRNLLILVQNLVLGVIVYAAVFKTVPVWPVGFVGGAILLTAVTFSAAYCVTLLSLRFRNLPQTLTGLLHTAFFMTPLLWPDYFLGRYQFLNQLNPFYHLVVLVRNPLLGLPTPAVTWLVGLGLLVLSAATAWFLHRLARANLCYWL